ncbi:hypothetical protein MNQ96_03570 [Sphingopyxis granuli]|uniref:hypothetical protein n=1 Tax=Sphingopyxis granuli TaxID=267128 RepID=UPI001F53B7FD|nr:hypothetical protein [Sphingopyxis granuli]UNK80176.1 hypothetical protein MNQ96_03570 [Sphingopyxis granuli]
MTVMLLAAALSLAASTQAAAPAPQPTAVGVARARILAPAEVRRVNGRIEVRTGRKDAPTQVHRTDRRDGGETADFY